jgi:hypothetical protein
VSNLSFAKILHYERSGERSNLNFFSTAQCTTFSKKQGRPFKDVNVMAESEVDEFIQDIKAKIDL